MSSSGLDFLRHVLSEIETNSDELLAPYEQSAYVYAAVSRIAATVAAIPTKLVKNKAFKSPNYRARYKELAYRIDEPTTVINKKLADLSKAPGDPASEDITEHPILEVLSRPNPVMVESQLWDKTVTYLLTQGQAFWIKDKKGEELQRIWCKHPNTFTPKTENGKFLGWSRASRQGVLDDQASVDYKPEDVCWFYKPHPREELKGFSPTVPAYSNVKQSFLGNLFNEMFFKNGASVEQYFVTDDPLSPAQVEALKEDVKNAQEGVRNKGKSMILHSGLKPLPGTSQKDMEFRSMQEWTFAVVLAVFGVPRAVIGGQEENVNRSSFEDAKRAFFSLTIIPLLKYLSEVIYHELLKEIDPTLYFVFDLALVEGLRGTWQETAAAARDLLSSGFTRNEVNRRFDMGFPDVPWGDTAFGNASLRAFDKLKDAEVEPEEPKEEVDPDDEENITNPNGDTRARQLKSLREFRKVFKVEEFLEEFFDPNVKRYERDVNVTLTQIEADIIRRIEALDVEETKNLSPKDISSILAAEQEYLENYSKIARERAGSTAVRARTSVAFELGGVFAFDLEAAEIISIMERSVERVVTSYKGTLATLRSTLLEGLLAGEKNETLISRVSTVTKLSKARANTIARTETGFVFSAIRHEAYKAEGVQSVEWITSGDEEVRTSHTQLGQLGARKLGHNYCDELGKAGRMEFPSDPRGPSEEVINCRCVLLAGDDL